MNWYPLNTTKQIEDAIGESEQGYVLIFKHSTRCSISSMAKSRLERAWQGDAAVKPYLLDLISNREVSDAVAQQFGIVHESPQVILLKEGKAVYHDSHMNITFDKIVGHIP